MYQCDSAVTAAAAPSATGSAHLSQRRLRHPIAPTATSSASTCAAEGNQPCSKDSWPTKSLNGRDLRCGPASLSLCEAELEPDS